MAHEQNFVVFRRWRSGGGIIALFPEIPADICGNFCEAYEQIGQHGGADYHGVIGATNPATVQESTSLTNELSRIGYKLKPVLRVSSDAHERRRSAARAIRKPS